MAKYVSKGKLTGTIASHNVTEADNYLREDDMTEFLPSELEGVVVHVEWRLKSNGVDYEVMAIATRALTETELESLREWTSGQNSDGLGEGFEQQDFAWKDGYEYDGMISFDWKTNNSTFEKLV